MSDPVQAARALAPRAAEAAAASERERRLDAGLVAELAAAGFFRLCVPQAVGGLEAHPAVLVEVVEELARGDAAAGWCVAITATSGLLAAYVPEDAARAIYARPDAVAGGVFAPRGRAVRVDDGFRVTGRWPFASGCEHCHWLMGGCVVDRGDGELETLPNGMPDIRLMLAPADRFEIHDTWHVSGLRATGSHDIELRDEHVPDAMAASVISDTPRYDGPLYAFPLFGLLALAIAGVSLGIGRGALDDFAALAGAKVPTGGRRALAERGTVQAEIARAEASLRAARALLLEAIGAAWGAVDVERRTGLRLAATHAVETGAAVAETAYRLGGGSALYESSPLQRRFRDANAATQHMLVAPATWELTGRLLLGTPTDTTQL
jgi:alkylation response protein AidB-like acyl-CoA dehydrogenase